MLTQSSFLFRKKCTVSIQDDFTELEIVRLYETRLRLSTMLIVTESINADREPNKTHNEPSTARVPWCPWPLQAEMETFVGSK